jgi:hypothetical protein
LQPDLIFEMPRAPRLLAKGFLILFPFVFLADCARHFPFPVPIVTAIRFDGWHFLA